MPTLSPLHATRACFVGARHAVPAANSWRCAAPAPRNSPRSSVVRVAWICFVAVLLLITAPLWHAAFEAKPLKISRVVPDHAAAGNWVEIDGDNFTRASRFFFDRPGVHVQARHVVFIDSHRVFVQVP